MKHGEVACAAMAGRDSSNLVGGDAGKWCVDPTAPHPPPLPLPLSPLCASPSDRVYLILFDRLNNTKTACSCLTHELYFSFMQVWMVVMVRRFQC